MMTAGAMRDRLRVMVDQTIPLYVLIDPLIGDPPTPIAISGDSVDGGDLASLRPARWGRNIETVHLHKSIALPADLHPYLVALHGIDDPLLDYTAAQAVGEHANAIADGLEGSGGAAHRIGGWLQSSQPPCQLAACIAAMCRLNTEAITAHRYLRIIDRRVLGLLAHTLGPDRLTSQFGPLQQWTYLNVFGAPETLINHDQPGAAPPALYLSRQELNLLIECEAIHRTLLRCIGERRQIGASTDDLHSHKRYRHVSNALTAARRVAKAYPQRFALPADLTTWAALTLAYPGIETASGVLAYLGAAGSPDEPVAPVTECHRELLAQAASDVNAHAIMYLTGEKT